MATTDCGYGKIVSVHFIETERTQEYRWVDESFFYQDFLGNTGHVRKWVLKRLIKCKYLNTEYWQEVASLTKKSYNSH